MPNPCPICAQPKITMEGIPPERRDAKMYRCACCGDFSLDGLAGFDVPGRDMGIRYRLAAATRAASDAGHPLFIECEAIERLAAGAPRFVSPFDGVDRLLLLMSRRANSILGSVPIEKETDFPLVGALGPQQMNELLVLAGRLTYIDPLKMTISIDGLRRIDELRTVVTDSRQVFVAMWFDPSLDTAWADGFKPGIESHGYFNAVRVDGIEHNGKIDDKIVAEIRRSGLMVADLTGERGGVYYEAGLAMGLGIPVI